MREEARTRAAGALRRLGHALVSHEADDDLLDRVADVAARAAGDLEASPPRERDLVELKRRMFEVEVDEGERVSHFDECFVSGAQNPLGVAIEVRREGVGVAALVQLGPAFEGAPARAHGGIVAAVFDDLMGYLLTLLKQPAFTGELTVRYEAAVPLEKPLTFRARILGHQGRKILTAAEAYADGEVVATATATFIAIDFERLRS